MKWGHSLSLKVKFSLAFALLSLAVSTALILVLYLNVRSGMRNDLREGLRRYVALSAMLIDVDTHATFTVPSDEDRSDYMRMSELLGRIQQAGEGIRFIYTLRQGPQGKVEFVVDPASAPEEQTHLGELYDPPASSRLENLVAIDRPVVEEEFVTDQWGTYLSGYAPLYTSAGVLDGVLGIDIAAARVLARERQFLWVASGLYCVIAPLATAIGWVVGRRLAIPIGRLKAGVERIAGGDLEFKVPVRADGEIEALARAFNGMGDRLSQSLGALREREEQVRLLLNSTAEAIYGLDLEGCCTFCNPASLELLGYARERDLLGKKMHQLIHHTRPDGSAYPVEECLVCRVFHRGEGCHVSDELFWRSDGSGFPVEYRSLPVKKGGQTVGAVVTFLDISERLKIEKMKDEMLSAISHEMRTPLTAILGFAEFMLEHEVPIDQQRDCLGMIAKEGARLKELIDNLLLLQRLRAGYGVLEFKPVAVLPLLHQTAKYFDYLPDRQRLVIECPQGLPIFRGEEEQLQRALVNLVSNAFKYAGEGGCITLGASLDEQEVHLWVKDQGQGIPQELLEQIFDRFFRIDVKEGKTLGGTGLGLQLVKEVAQAHGGRAWAESIPGQGSTFYLSIPRSDREPG